MKMALPKQLSATLRMECSAYECTHSLPLFIHIHVVKQHLLAFCKPQQLGWRPGTKLRRNVLFFSRQCQNSAGISSYIKERKECKDAQSKGYFLESVIFF